MYPIRAGRKISGKEEHGQTVCRQVCRVEGVRSVPKCDRSRETYGVREAQGEIRVLSYCFRDFKIGALATMCQTR